MERVRKINTLFSDFDGLVFVDFKGRLM